MAAIKTTKKIKQRLEYLRGCLKAENISYEGIHELQSFALHIEPGDVELLEPAGVPEEFAHLSKEERAKRMRENDDPFFDDKPEATKAIADMLWDILPKDPEHEDRVRLDNGYGTKTKLGLRRTIEGAILPKEPIKPRNSHHGSRRARR